ncbi:hypothetical protein tb265_31440 [Gemmatimonadetes bacterium T265]|nr:hypothetical protein tb265_31440 [Gemmatimonadetes bacterium T265]
MRAGLLLLACAATAPFIVLTVWRARTRAAEARAAAASRALETAHIVAARLDARSEVIGTLLSALAPQVRRTSAGTAANDSLLLAVKSTLPAPAVTNLWVQDRTGANIGTSRRPVPPRAAINAADRPYFQEALATRRPTVSDPVRARPDSSIWSVIFAHPVTTAAGDVQAVVLGTVHLPTLGHTLDATGLPPGSTVVLADAHGHVVASAPIVPAWIGRPLDATVRPPHTLDGADGVSVDEDARADGRPDPGRLIAAVRPRLLPWRVYVVLPTSAAFAPVQHELRRDITLGGLTLGVALLLALVAARRITRPLGDLTADATALAAGDHTRRTPADLPGELGTLAATFSEMAATLTARTAELHRSEQRYRSLFEASPLPMYLADVGTYTVLAANDAALAQYGYTGHEFTRRTLLDLRPESERLIFLAESHVWRSPAAGTRRTPRVTRHLRRDGTEFDAEVYTADTEYEGRPARLSVTVDVTARREAERALAESQEQLRRGQKMEALGRFAGGIAHDFNNLLTGILGACDLALADLPHDSPVRDDVALIRDSARRAAALTGQILSFSRGHVTQFSVLAPADVVAELEPMLARVIGEDVRLKTSGIGRPNGTSANGAPEGDAAARPATGRVLADRGQLEQVVMNLVLNARDAMPSGGTLGVDVSDVDVHAPDPDHPGVPTGPWVRLAVCDSGIGMDDATQARIFEPFFTTKARGKGTGLGLATVYGIVTQAGGLVRVTSAPGEGSTFVLYLPRVAAATDRQATPANGVYVGAPARAAARAPDGDDSPATVLLVEDERTVRTIAREALVRGGYRVLVAEEGMQALAVARTHRGPIDLLLTDVVMPGLSGRELAEALAQERPDTRVLFTSGYTEDEVLHRGVSADAVAFLPKPFTPEVLVGRVAAVLGIDPAAV